MVNKKLELFRNGTYKDAKKSRDTLYVNWSKDNGKKAVVIGINPSRADNDRSDKTITTTARYLDSHGYGEFTMLNLYENYSTSQDGIDITTYTDFEKYEQIFLSVDSIIIAWGVDNNYKIEKTVALNYLKRFALKLMCIENKNGSKPLHPSRIAYEYRMTSFVIDK